MAVIHLAVAASNAMINALIGLMDADLGAPTIEVRSGAMPATPADAAGGTLLATFTLDATASFGAPVDRTATLDASPAITATGVAAGEAAWARIADQSGDVVLDCDVSAVGGGGVLQINTTTVSVGLELTLSAGTITLPM